MSRIVSVATLIVLAFSLALAALAAEPSQPPATPATSGAAAATATAPAAPAPGAPAAAPEPPAKAAPACVYKGKPRDNAWVDAQFEKFKDKIAFVKGKFVDVGKAAAEAREVDTALPEAGTELRRLPDGCRMMQPLGDFEFLAMCTSPTAAKGSPPGQPPMFHMTGMAPAAFGGGGAAGPQWVMYVGPYVVSGHNGQKTYPSFTPFKPLTHDEFLDAIASKFLLVEYAKLTVRPAKAGAPNYRIVAKPVM
jgi:hypothetical protein